MKIKTKKLIFDISLTVIMLIASFGISIFFKKLMCGSK